MGTILGPFGILLGISVTHHDVITGINNGFSKQGKIVKEIFNADKHQKDFTNNFQTKLEKDDGKKIINDNLKKFVYFKDNKIVGFIKFTKDIIVKVSAWDSP